MNRSISQAFVLFRNVILAGLLVALVTNFASLYRLQVGGMPYQRIIASKDLVADVLPPPEYVIESYLLVLLAIDQPNQLQFYRERLQKLEAEYGARHDFWLRSTLLPERLRDMLIVDAHAEAAAFWSVVDAQFLPAMQAGNREGALAALRGVGEHYEAHRRLIDKVVVQANVFAQEVEASAAVESFLFSIVMLGASATIFLLTWIGIRLLRRKACAPLVALAQFMTELAAGDYYRRAPFCDSGDEIGEMARSVEVFREALVERETARTLAAQAELRRQEEIQHAQAEATQRERALVNASIGTALSQLSDKKLTCRVSDNLPEAYYTLRDDFNTAATQLESAIAGIATSADMIGSGVGQISEAADDLARRTERQAASLEEMSAALGEINDSLHAMAKDTQAASGITGATRTEAERSEGIMRAAVGAMQRIEKSSEGIEEIIGVVDEIAFQTNLLALNAGVEAARAGESGKGFAVVASEVRALAQRSAEAAKEIKQLIRASAMEVDQGVELVQATAAALQHIVGQVTETDAIIRRITSSATRQASGLAEIASAAGQIDHDTQRNAAMVEETTAATHNLRQEIEDLVSAFSTFQIGRTVDRRAVELIRRSSNAAAA